MIAHRRNVVKPLQVFLLLKLNHINLNINNINLNINKYQPQQQQRQQQQRQPQKQQQYAQEIPEYDDYDTQYPRKQPYNQIDIDLDKYLDEEPEEDLNDEFDDALPPLEDMLLLITNPEIHKAYNYVLPKRNPMMPQQKLQQQPSYSQPTYQQQQFQQFQQQQASDIFPPLDQTAWSVSDCEIVVVHLKKLLMSVLQDALTVKKLDLHNSANANQAETIFRNSGNQLKEIRELITAIARIDTQNSQHNAIQADVERLSDVMIKSTVVMLRTAMNVTKRAATIDQFNNAYNPFYSDAKNLIGRVNNLQFGCWGPNEVFFA